MSVEQERDALAAKCGRLRDALEVYQRGSKGCGGHPKSCGCHWHSVERLLAETPEQSLEAILAPYKAQCSRLQDALDTIADKVMVSEDERTQTYTFTNADVLKVLQARTETPEASLKAVKREARREALEEAAAIVDPKERTEGKLSEGKAAEHLIRSLLADKLRALAAQDFWLVADGGLAAPPIIRICMDAAVGRFTAGHMVSTIFCTAIVGTTRF